MNSSLKKFSILLSVSFLIFLSSSCDIFGNSETDSKSPTLSEIKADFTNIVIFKQGSTVTISPDTALSSKNITSQIQVDNYSVEVFADSLDWYVSFIERSGSENKGNSIDFTKCITDANNNIIVTGSFYRGDFWDVKLFGVSKGCVSVSKANVFDLGLVNAEAECEITGDAKISNVVAQTSKILTTGKSGHLVVNVAYKMDGIDIFRNTTSVSATFMVGDNTIVVDGVKYYDTNKKFDGSYDFILELCDFESTNKSFKLSELNITTNLVEYSSLKHEGLNIEFDEIFVSEFITPRFCIQLQYCNHDYVSFQSIGKDKHVCICSKCGAIKPNSEEEHLFGTYSYDDNKHRHTCMCCGQTEETFHDFGMYNSLNSENHQRTCLICGKNEIKKHTYEYLNINDEQHRKFCTFCNREELENHNLTCICVDGFTHAEVCINCNKTIYANHKFGSYVYDASTHRLTCEYCNYISEECHNFDQNGRCLTCGYGSKVGQLGLSGGWIFYDCDADNSNGNADGLISSECGWRYLEAAPSDLEGMYVFGFYRASADSANLYVNGTTSYSSLNCTLRDIGTGKRNTELLIARMGINSYGTADGIDVVECYAAKKCQDYSINGYNDWFLPSLNELTLMYDNLDGNDIGNFSKDADCYYWSSSEDTVFSAWIKCFYCGHIESIERGRKICSIRPIRAF